MNFINNLSQLIYYHGFTAPTVSGLTQWITWFITLFASTGLGIILFTIILKVITLPLDYASRASMRKNSLKMEEMRPELEKLQKQYANDKQLYQAKMMELYKKNGYSAFGACLPTIVTLVLFIIVLQSFNKYSNYQNVKDIYNMNVAFNNVIDYGIEDVKGYISHNDEGIVVVKDDAIWALKESDEVIINDEETGVKLLTATYFTKEDKNYVRYQTPNGYVYMEKEYEIDENDNVSFKTPYFYVVTENLKNSDLKNEKGQTFNDYIVSVEDKTISESALAETFILDVQQLASAEKYKEERQGFLWIKNIWMTDSPMDHPVYKDYETLKSKYPTISEKVYESQYNNLTAKLSKEKGQANGFFILVVLTAGSALLMQLVAQKSQKAQLELQSVDGSAMQTQKIMTWMMPIMMAIFAFMYTAAFSLYMITSSAISILTTFLINFIVDIQLTKEKSKKKEENKTKYYGETSRSTKGLKKNK